MQLIILLQVNFAIKEFNKRLKQKALRLVIFLHFAIKEFNKRLKLNNIF